MTVDEALVMPDEWEQPAPPAETRASALWFAVLVLGFAAQAGWRLYLSLPIVGPIAHGDEDGYLLGARILSGGPDATLPVWSIMRPIGYPLIISPVYWFTQEPSHVYVGVHIVNALLMAATFPLLYAFARRLFGIGRAWSAVVAFVLATLPSMVFFSQFALTDALLPTIVMLLLLAVHGMLTNRPSLWPALGAGAIAGYAANTHVRGLVMLVALAAVVAIGAVCRWFTRGTVLACAVAAGVVFAVGRAGNRWLEAKLFPAGAVTVDDRILERLTTWPGVERVLCDGAGQIWHLCTSTWGLAALGLAGAIRALVRREWTSPTRIVLAMALAITVGIALATAAGIPDEGRVNNHVYGRYVAMFAAFWALVAVVALARTSWRRAAWLVAGGSVIMLGTLGAVYLWAGRRMRTEEYVNFDAPELSFLAGDYTSLHIYRVTAFALGFMVLFAVLLGEWRRLRQARGTLTMAVLLALNLVAMVAITDGISLAWARKQYHPGPPTLVDDIGVRPGETIAESTTMTWSVNQRHQREVYWRPLTAFDPSVGPPPGFTYVVATIGKETDWDGARHGYVEVFRYRESRTNVWVVWRRR